MGLHDSRVAVGGSGDGRRRAGQVAGQVGEEVWEPSTQVTGHATSPTGSRVSSPRKWFHHSGPAGNAAFWCKIQSLLR